jgi:hypothetical protein
MIFDRLETSKIDNLGFIFLGSATRPTPHHTTRTHMATATQSATPTLHSSMEELQRAVNNWIVAQQQFGVVPQTALDELQRVVGYWCLGVELRLASPQ